MLLLRCTSNGLFGSGRHRCCWRFREEACWFLLLHWNFVYTFELGTGQVTVRTHYQVWANKDRQLLYFQGPDLYAGEGSFGSRKNVLKEFAEVTGGKFFFVKKATELGTVYQRIAEELGKQYYLTYSTSNDQWNGRWIKLKVESLRDGVEIRARRGYFAVRTPGIGG